jgi:hypothetical protein
MFSVTSIISVIIGGVIAYFLWKMLKALFVVIGIATVIAAAVFWWAHADTTTTNTTVQKGTTTPTGLVENGARWLTRPIHDAAQQVVNLTQDEKQFVKKMHESSTDIGSWLQQVETVKAKLPVHLLKPSQGGLSQKKTSHD